jgi:hypothetical protein
MRGARKRDYPPFFTAHEPWWDGYHTLEQYFTRLSVALSAGKQHNDVLVLEPTTTAWLHQSVFDPSQKETLAAIGSSYFALLMSLERTQIPYDIGSEDVLARMGRIEDRALHVGQAHYRTLVIPPMTENLNGKTVDLLSGLAANGGNIFACGDPPPLVDGQPSDAPAILSKSRIWHRVEPKDVPAQLADIDTSPLRVRRADDDRGTLFQHRRRLDCGELLFMVNTSIDHPSSGTVLAKGFRGAECWDPHSGVIGPASFRYASDAVTTEFALPPCGSLLLLFTKEHRDPLQSTAAKWEALEPVGLMRARRLQPNVLTLDFVDITANGKTLNAVYCPNAGDFAFKQYGLHGNPANRGVQFRDEWITRQFPPDSGFEATYHFDIQGTPPKCLRAVIERADLYAIECNGKPLKPIPGESWLEPAFHMIDISAAAATGANALTIRATPLTIYHELEPAYLLGDFTLRPGDTGFSIVAATSDLADPVIKWNAAGLPLYGHDVLYAQTFRLDKIAGQYRVELPSWNGSVARVRVNGELAGFIGWQPYCIDVTRNVRAGENTIEVIVSGTLKNTLGPHHVPDLRGIASPGHFSKGPQTGPPPGARYDTIGYGLFAPFVLSRNP